MEFVSKTKLFKEITDLAPFDRISGYYIMVLDEYTQAYIGRSTNIKNRIMSHWSKQKEFDRLVFGGKEKSILSIDSFRAYDTTRIFVYPTDNQKQEDYFINLFNKKYLLNRTKGGSLTGLGEAIANGKTRELDLN
ncbi:GIY-YIG nuclease family protein [Virgibacillus kimchii]